MALQRQLHLLKGRPLARLRWRTRHRLPHPRSDVTRGAATTGFSQQFVRIRGKTAPDVRCKQYLGLGLVDDKRNDLRIGINVHHRPDRLTKAPRGR